MLEVKNLCKTYRPKNGPPVQALKNVSVKFNEKGLVFILGKSGCGKSTLLNCIGGLDRFDSGEIIIKGKSSTEFKQGDFDSYRNTFIGFIFQEYNILSEFNIEKNIALALELQGKKATKEEVQRLLDMVDLGNQGSRKTNELSGGQKQRVAIARALIKDPEIIIADEPTGALDSATGIQVFDTLKKLSQDKLVIVVSHDREFAEIYGDRIIEMKDGIIISDETKRKVAPEELSTGVTVIGEDLIHIEKGHKLNDKEKTAILNFLDKQNQDVIISFDEKNNDKFKKVAKIDENNQAEKFTDTTDADRQTKNYNKNDLKFIKSKLRLRDSFKMGVSGLKAKPIRLIFTILLCLVAFTMFGVTDTISAFNHTDVTIKSLQDSNVNYLSFIKSSKSPNSSEDDVWYNDGTLMDSLDLSELKTKTGVDYKPVYALGNSNISFSDYIKDSSKISYDGMYSSNFGGIVELTKTDLDTLGYTLVSGKMPQALNEVVITKYDYLTFKYAGFKNDAVTPKVTLKPEEVEYSKIIGQEINLNYGSLDEIVVKIVGIVDTQFNEDRYKTLNEEQKENSGFDLTKYALSSELNTLQKYSYHNLIIGYTGVIDAIRNAIDGDDPSTIKIQNASSSVSCKENSSFYINNIVKESEKPTTKVIVYKSTTATTGNLVYLSIQDIAWKLKNDYNDGTTIEYNNGTYTQDIDLIDGDEELSKAVYESTNLYDFARMQNLVDNHPDYIQKIIDKFNQYYTLNYNYYDYQTSASEIKTPVALGGVHYTADEYGSSMGNIMYVSDNLFTSIKSMVGSKGYYTFAIAPMPTDRTILRKAITYHTNSLLDTKVNPDVKYTLKNEVSSTIDSVTDTITGVAKVLLYVGIGICVFASLMLMNFISTSISYKKREIGILRAIGARKKDVFSIFFNESLVIALINFVLSAIATFTVATIVNSSLRNQYGLLISFLNFSPRQIIILLGVSVAVAFVSSFLPVMKIAKKQPIDAINNR